jgi:hypothetical protein
MYRRILTGATLTLLLLVGLPASPASAQATTVTYTGPVEAGTFLELVCPEGTLVQYTQGGTQISAQALFYRNQRQPPAAAVNLPPDGVGGHAVYWTVPKGARYAEAYLVCEPPPVTVNYEGRFQAAGEQVTVLCPSGTPYVWSAGPTLLYDDAGVSSPLEQTRITDAASQWVGISFTAPEPGFYQGSLSCQWRPLE